MATVNAHRYDLHIEGADDAMLSAFAAALKKTRLDECIIQSPEDPSLFTSEAMDVEWRNGLYEETIEDALHSLAIAFPDMNLHFIAEDLDDRGQGFEVKFHGHMYQRADMVSILTEFSVPAPFPQRDLLLQKERERSIEVDKLLTRVTKETDYDLLYAQKLALLDALNNGTPIPKEALEGLVNFLDNMGDLGEALGRFKYDEIEPPYPMQPDYEKKICMFPPEPDPKVYLLCEEYEDDSCIREFRVLSVSNDEDSLKHLMRAKIEKDEYGFIAEKGVRDESDTHFTTEFNDGFVEYYILEEKVLSRDQALALLNTKAFDTTFYYPESLRTILTETLQQIVADEGYGELDVTKAVDEYLQDKKFQAELKDTYWFHEDHISSEDRARDFCRRVIYDELNENPDLLSDLGIVPAFKSPDNFRDILITSIYDAAKDLRLVSVNVEQISEECLHNGAFRMAVTEKFGSMKQSDDASEKAMADFCRSFLNEKLAPKSPEKNPGLDQIIAGAASRASSTSEKACEKETGR